MEVLTAYVRQHAPRGPEENHQTEEDAAAEKKSEENSSEESRPAKAQKPDPDIQAIMTVLRRRTRSFGHGESGHLDLRETNLSWAYLYGADLSGAYLSKANLSAVNLSEARNLTQGQLQQADGDKTTQLPPGLEPPAHWGVQTDEQVEGN